VRHCPSVVHTVFLHPLHVSTRSIHPTLGDAISKQVIFWNTSYRFITFQIPQPAFIANKLNMPFAYECGVLGHTHTPSNRHDVIRTMRLVLVCPGVDDIANDVSLITRPGKKIERRTRLYSCKFWGFHGVTSQKTPFFKAIFLNGDAVPSGISDESVSTLLNQKQENQALIYTPESYTRRPDFTMLESARTIGTCARDKFTRTF
jgi:hypothetical protein